MIKVKTNTHKIVQVYSEIINKIDDHLTRSILFSHGFKIGVSGDKEYVTNLDKEIEDICVNTLNLFFGGTPIIAEESFSFKTIEGNSSFFIVDPIDGTLNMLEGGEDWAVSIAFVHNNFTEIGMLYFPKKAIKILAIRGQGVWVNGLRLKRLNTCEKICLAVSPRQIKSPAFKQRLIDSGIFYQVVPHFTPKILAITTGKMSAATYLPQIGKGVVLWDYATGVLIVNELGGIITSFSGKMLNFSTKKIFHSDGWLASYDSQLHKRLLTVLRDLNLDKGNY